MIDGFGQDWQPRLARPVFAIAGGVTDFRKRHEMTQKELVMEAVLMAVEENDLNVANVGDFKKLLNFAVYSQFADHFGDQLLAAAIVHDYLGLNPLGNIEVKTGGATGGSAVVSAVKEIASGYADLVLVAGWEMMDEVSTRQGNTYIAHAACKDFEFRLGRIYTNYYALMARKYAEMYLKARGEAGRDSMSLVAAKNHYYASFSPFSQAPGNYSIEDITDEKISPLVADPLHLLECCTMSTGAAVLILASEDMAFKLSSVPVQIDGIGAGSDTMRTGDRRPRKVPLLPHEDPDLYKGFKDWPGFTSFLATRYAAVVAYKMAGIQNPLTDFDLAETHDAFSISALQSYEDLGFRPYGKGYEFIDSWDAHLGGSLPENLSGGLIGTMHAVGATGIWQVIEVLWQLQGKWGNFHADPRIWARYGKTMPEQFVNLQVPNARRGLAVSHAGTGSHVTAITLRRS